MYIANFLKKYLSKVAWFLFLPILGIGAFVGAQSLAVIINDSTNVVVNVTKRTGPANNIVTQTSFVCSIANPTNTPTLEPSFTPVPSDTPVISSTPLPSAEPSITVIPSVEPSIEPTATIQPTSEPPPQGNSRGYTVTDTELAIVKQKAADNIEPYKASVAEIISDADSGSLKTFNAPDEQCDRQNDYHHNSQVILAKAMAYHLTGDSSYADQVVAGLVDATNRSASGNPSGKGDQCNLNAAWYTQGVIQAADLMEGYSGWDSSKKRAFQDYLAESVYPYAEAAAHRGNNWGTGGSAAAVYIADYLWDRPDLSLRDLDGNQRSPSEAYTFDNNRQKARINGTDHLDSDECGDAGGAIMPDGAIPIELVRDSSGCDSEYIKELDGSYTYTLTYLESVIQHAELLHRRGDNSLYDGTGPGGKGSILKGIMFVIDNPNNPEKSWDWKRSHLHSLDVAYKYYRDPRLADQIGIGSNRNISGVCGQMFHYGTISHGFAEDENPTGPPIVSPP